MAAAATQADTAVSASEEVNQGLQLLFGEGLYLGLISGQDASSLPDCRGWLDQGFNFYSDPNLHPTVQFGLAQNFGGPCGVLAAVQGRIVQRMAFQSDPPLLEGRFSPAQFVGKTVRSSRRHFGGDLGLVSSRCFSSESTDIR